MRGQEAAVSSVVGTVLMLGVTMTVFAGVSLVVLDHFDEVNDKTRADVAVLQRGGAMVVQHRGGEPLRLSDATLTVNVEGQEQAVPMTALAGLFADPARWRIGESLCVSCLYPSQSVDGVLLAHAGELVLREGQRGTPAPPLTGVTDLRAANLQVTPATPLQTIPATISATIVNDGDTVGPSEARLLVDGSVVATFSIPALGTGAYQPIETSWATTPGTYTVTVEADVGDAIAEDDEADNTASTTVTVATAVADPGHAYEDVDLNGLYDPSVDLALSPSAIQDGAHDAGPRGLVLPASVGPISADNIDFRGAQVRLSVDVTAHNADAIVQATGDVFADGTSITASQSGRLVRVQGQHLFLDAAALSAGASVLVVPNGDVHAAGATFTAGTNVDIGWSDNNAKTLDLTTTTVNAGNSIRVQGTTVDGNGGTWTAALIIDTRSTGTASLANAAWVTTTAGADVYVAAVNIDASASDVRAIDALDFLLTQKPGRLMSIPDAFLRAGGLITLDANDRDNTVDVSNGHILDLGGNPKAADVKPNGGNSPILIGTLAEGTLV